MLMNAEEMKWVYNHLISKRAKSLSAPCVSWRNVSEVTFIDLSERAHSLYIMYSICALYKSLAIYTPFYADELSVVFDIPFTTLSLANGTWLCPNRVVGALETWFMFCCWHMCLLYLMRSREGLCSKGCLRFTSLSVSCASPCLYLLWGGRRFLGWDSPLRGSLDSRLPWSGCLYLGGSRVLSWEFLW